jgi:hypothetical protein
VKPGKAKLRLKEMENGSIVPAAWSVLRWCVAPCTACLEEMSDEQGVGAYSRFLRYLFLDPQRRTAADRCTSAVNRLGLAPVPLQRRRARRRGHVPEGTAERDNDGRECEEVPDFTRACVLPSPRLPDRHSETGTRYVFPSGLSIDMC